MCYTNVNTQENDSLQFQVANKSSISDLHCALYKQAFQPRDVRNCEASTSCDKPESVRSRSDTAANNPSAPVPYEDAIIRDVMASDKVRRVFPERLVEISDGGKGVLRGFLVKPL